MKDKARAALTEPMLYILMSLLKRDMCGVEIMDFVESRTGGRVRLGPGTLYTLTAKFLDEELIREAETEREGRRRTYALTAKGRAAFDGEIERLRSCIADGEEELS